MTTRLATKKPEAIQLMPALKEYFQTKLAAEMGPHDVKHMMDIGRNNFVVLDVRSTDAYQEGHIPGAMNIPLEELSRRLGELDNGKEIIAYCWTTACLLCTKAAYLLVSHGYLAREMVGGIEAWKAAGFATEK